MIRTIAIAGVLSLTVAVLPAVAADSGDTQPAKAEQGVIASNTVWCDNLTLGTRRVTAAISRPAVLPALYASYAALQAFDVYSTKQALARGAREANPLMQSVVGNTGAFVAMKVGVGVATIVAAERLWKTNKAAASGVMIAGNSVAAMVAARNARTLGQLR